MLDVWEMHAVREVFAVRRMTGMCILLWVSVLCGLWKMYLV